MAVGFKVGFFWYQIGSGDFLHCFFSTVAVNLENGSWGSRFPLIMNKLYQGSLDMERNCLRQNQWFAESGLQFGEWGYRDDVSVFQMMIKCFYRSDFPLNRSWFV